MPKFKVKNIMQYTEELEFDAANLSEAKIMAEEFDLEEFDRVHDDTSVDMQVTEL